VTDYSFKLGNSGSPYLKFSGWRLILFGLILVVVMRLRPEGFLPARRDRQKKGA
jgi:branched-chain amino acid transport system permease protein